MEDKRRRRAPSLDGRSTMPTRMPSVGLRTGDRKFLTAERVSAIVKGVESRYSRFLTLRARSRESFCARRAFRGFPGLVPGLERASFSRRLAYLIRRVSLADSSFCALYVPGRTPEETHTEPFMRSRSSVSIARSSARREPDRERDREMLVTYPRARVARPSKKPR